MRALLRRIPAVLSLKQSKRLHKGCPGDVFASHSMERGKFFNKMSPIIELSNKMKQKKLSFIK